MNAAEIIALIPVAEDLVAKVIALASAAHATASETDQATLAAQLASLRHANDQAFQALDAKLAAAAAS